MLKLERKVTICNKLGLHARAATQMAVMASEFDAKVTIIHGDKTASADSVLGLLMLESSIGKEITLIAEGRDAKKALDALSDLINKRFNE